MDNGFKQLVNTKQGKERTNDMGIDSNNSLMVVNDRQRRITMSDMKCPFCQQKLDYDDLLGSCINEHCEESFDMVGTESLWQKVINLKQELDRTRKALDIAVDALKKYTDASGNWWYGYEFQGHYEDYAGEYADKALEQITALEQKD